MLFLPAEGNLYGERGKSLKPAVALDYKKIYKESGRI